jgi:modulator of FtsH protease
MSMMSATDKLFGTTTLDERQAALAKKTYALLSVSIATAVLGGWIGSTTPAIVEFGMHWYGWVTMLVLINVVPHIALWASKKNPTVGLLALGADGFISGLALSPLLWVASIIAPQAVPAALGVTAAVFVAVTGYIMLTRERFSAPAGLLTGIFFSLIAASILNIGLGFSLLSVVISIGIGILGVLMLVYATSEVLNNPDYQNPVQGALMLFAALFNIFVSALRLMLRLYGGGRD